MAIVEAYMETSETYGDVVSNLLIELPRNPDLQGSFNVLWKNIQIILTQSFNNTKPRDCSKKNLHWLVLVF